MTGRTRPTTTAAHPGPLWERPEPLSRDRSSHLTREEIAAAAFAIAENENLAAVSVKRVAGRLGLPAARLQNYLADRGDLLDLMVEIALGEVAVVSESLAWQVQVWHLAHAIRDEVRRRPWLAGLLGLRAASGPNGLRFTERCLRATIGADVDVSTAAQCVETMLTFVCSSVRPGPSATAVATPDRAADTARYLAGQISADTFPLLAQLIQHPTSMTADELFDAGLSWMLAGMATGFREVNSDLARTSGTDVAPDP